MKGDLDRSDLTPIEMRKAVREGRVADAVGMANIAIADVRPGAQMLENAFRLVEGEERQPTRLKPFQS